MDRLSHYGSIAASVAAILGLLWLIGEPFLEDYVDGHIRSYDERMKEEQTNSVSLRHLLSDKMGVSDDEVHIELGKTYKKVKNEKDVLHIIDSLAREINLNYQEIGVNIKDINALKRTVIDLEQSKKDN